MIETLTATKCPLLVLNVTSGSSVVTPLGRDRAQGTLLLLRGHKWKVLEKANLKKRFNEKYVSDLELPPLQELERYQQPAKRVKS